MGGTVVRPDVATWTGPDEAPVTRQTVSLDDPPRVQTWRLVGYLGPDGGWYGLGDPDAEAGLFGGLWVLDDEAAMLCGCSHPSDLHARLGRGRCASAACGCSAFHLPRAQLGGLRC